jgi:hypothetical protein
MSLNFDTNKFTYYDSSILKELYDEARAIPPGGLDDFLKLPVNPNYKSTVYSPQGFQEQKMII